MQIEYDEKKHHYDSTALQLQSNMAKLETGVKGLRDEIQGLRVQVPHAPQPEDPAGGVAGEGHGGDEALCEQQAGGQAEISSGQVSQVY